MLEVDLVGLLFIVNLLPLLILVGKVNLTLLELVSQACDFLLEVVALCSQVFNGRVLLLNVALEVLLFLFGILVLAFLSGLLVAELLVVVLDFFNFLLLPEQVIFHAGDALHQSGLLLLELVDEVILGSDLILQLSLLLHHLCHRVVLADIQAGTLVHNLGQVADLVFEVGDNFSGFLFVVLSLLDEFPGLLYLPAEDGNRLRVFLGKLDGSLDS